VVAMWFDLFIVLNNQRDYMPLSTQDYLEKLRNAIGSPETWERFKGDWEFRRVLLFYWSETAKKYQSFWEMNYYNQYEALEGMSEELLKRIEVNASYWRPRAVEESM